jgi:hypothetical protein
MRALEQRISLVAGLLASLFVLLTVVPASAQEPPSPTVLTIPPPESLTTTTTAAPDRPGSAVQPGSQSGLTVSPAIVDNTVDPGAQFSVPITVFNITPKPVGITASPDGLDPNQPIDPSVSAEYNISSWFSIAEPMFLLAPGENKSVDVSVTVPENAEPGGHYATIYFQAADGDESQDASAKLSARVGVVVLLTVKGDLRPNVELVGQIETAKTQFAAGPTTFTFDLRNTGNVHFQPEGSLVVKDVFGREVKTLPLPVGYLLPGTQRSYEVTWERGVRPGWYTADVSLQAGITLQATSQRFLLLPLILVLPLLVLLVGLLLGILLRVQSKKRRAKRKAAVALITAPELIDATKESQDKESKKDANEEPSS